MARFLVVLSALAMFSLSCFSKDDEAISTDVILKHGTMIFVGSKDEKEVAIEKISHLSAYYAVPPLLIAIQERDIVLKGRAYAALCKVTGQTFDFEDTNAWSKWWRENERRLKPGPVSDPSATPITYGKLAKIYFDEGNLNKAQENAVLAIIEAPGVAEYQFLLGTILVHKKEKPAATIHFQVASKLDPANEEYKRRLAEVKEEVEQIDLAERERKPGEVKDVSIQASGRAFQDARLPTNPASNQSARPAEKDSAMDKAVVLQPVPTVEEVQNDEGKQQQNE